MSSISKPWKYVRYFFITTSNVKMSDKKHLKKEDSYCLQSKKPTRNKDIHEALTLVNLILQQS